jgi:hypothetical protein
MPDMRVKPPAAAKESVHPGKGYSIELAMIEGRNTTTGRSPLFLARVFSAMLLVNV